MPVRLSFKKRVSIEDAQSPEEIAARVLEVEHQIFPEAIKLLVEERLEIAGLRVRIKGVSVRGKD